MVRIERGERHELEVMMDAENAAGDGHPEWAHVRHGMGVFVAVCLMMALIGLVWLLA